MKMPPLYLLESFLSFGRSKNLQSAAQELGISQPALTIQLKQLQEYFAKPLYSNEGRRKVLSPFGKILHQAVHDRLGSINQIIRSAVDANNDPDQALVRLGGRIEILSFIAERLKAPNPTQFISLNTASAVEALLSQTCEFAISRLEQGPSYLYRKKLFENSFQLILPKSWKIRSDRITEDLLNSISQKPYLAYSTSDELTRQLFERYKVRCDLNLHRCIESWPSLLRSAEQDQGWAFAPSIYSCNPDLVHAIDAPTSLIKPVQYYLYYRKETLSEPWFAGFKNRLHECFK